MTASEKKPATEAKLKRFVQLWEIDFDGGGFYLGAVQCKKWLTEAEFDVELERIQSLKGDYERYFEDEGELDFADWLCNTHGYQPAELPHIGWIVFPRE